MKAIILLIISLLTNFTEPPKPAAFSSDHCCPSIIEAPNARRLNVVFIGDIMSHTPQYKSARQTDGSYDFSGWFEYMKPYFLNADLTMGNLETTLSDGKYSGYPMFRTPLALADAIVDAGFDILGTANNHSLDGRLKGLEFTLQALRERDIASTGTYMANEVATPLVVKKNGIALGVIASTYGTNGIALPEAAPHVVNISSEALYKEQIAMLRERDIDVIIAFIHWGREYHRKPSQGQIDFARKLAESGVDVIIGSHPHVIEADDWIERADGGKSYVVYSLGNAISNQRQRYKDSGLALNLTFVKENDCVAVDSVDYLPFWVDKYDATGKIAYAMIPLYDTPELERLSKDDQIKMKQALNDFEALFQIVK